MKWESNRVKKAKYLKIGPVDLRSMGLIFFCLPAVWVGVNAGVLRQLLLSPSARGLSQLVLKLAAHRRLISLSTSDRCDDVSAEDDKTSALTPAVASGHVRDVGAKKTTCTMCIFDNVMKHRRTVSTLLLYLSCDSFVLWLKVDFYWHQKSARRCSCVTIGKTVVKCLKPPF